MELNASERLSVLSLTHVRWGSCGVGWQANTKLGGERGRERWKLAGKTNTKLG